MSTDSSKSTVDPFRAQLSTFGWKFINDWSVTLSALMAYYFLIALIPLIICLFSAAILISGKDSLFVNKVHDGIEAVFTGQSIAQIADTLQNSVTNQAITVFIITFIVAVITSSRLFTGIDDTLTIIYRIRERTIIKQNIHAVKLLLVFIVLTTIIVICLAIPGFVTTNPVFYEILSILLNGLFIFILYCFIYYFVPQRKMSFSKIWCGALFAAIGSLILISLFPLYVDLFLTNYVGQIGFIIIILILFYLFGLLLVTGAQINAFFFDHIQPLPAGLGDCLSGFANHENIPLIDVNSQPNNSMSTLVEGLKP